MKEAQSPETVKSRVPSIWFVWKIWDFLVAQGQKLGARGHQALLQHSPGRHLRERERQLFHNCNKLNETNSFSAKISREFENSRICTPSLLIRLGHQQINITLSNPNIDARILAQDYCVAIISLSLLWT